ncbi:MAG TPA: carboxypeptidase, partial [Candidatus Marinimicrobia bacterium]|nr:carboxypeptidase [Candidatus Neomarinimicrobiota bacterium]
MKPIETLKNELREITDLKGAVNVLYWDMETYMPKGGTAARAKQVAMLEAMVHERFIGEDVSNPLGELVNLDSGEIINGLDDETSRLVIEIWRDYHRAVALPKEFVEELSHTSSMAHPDWVEAREKNDFNLFAPHLEKLIALKHREIGYLGTKDTPYDTLLDEFEPGFTTANINELFGELKTALVPMIKKIQESGVDTKQEILHQYY